MPRQDPNRTIRSLAMKRHLLALLALLAAAPAAATPSAALVSSDQLLGANERSFFVLRTTTIWPGSHYQVIRRLEFLEVSAWDGTLRDGCTLRETTSDQDAASDNGVWTHRDSTLAPCDPAARLRAASADYPAPRHGLAPAWPVTFSGDDITISRGDGAAPARLLDWAYVVSRAGAMTTGTGPEAPCPFCEATEGLAPAEACTLDPAATEFPFAPWVFLRLVCWDGSSDLSGAVVHIPVSRKTYTEGHSE